MTLGERLYLGLVLVNFLFFGVSLAAISWSNERFLRKKAADEAARQGGARLSKKAA